MPLFPSPPPVSWLEEWVTGGPRRGAGAAAMEGGVEDGPEMSSGKGGGLSLSACNINEPRCRGRPLPPPGACH